MIDDWHLLLVSLMQNVRLFIPTYLLVFSLIPTYQTYDDTFGTYVLYKLVSQYARRGCLLCFNYYYLLLLFCIKHWAKSKVILWYFLPCFPYFYFYFAFQEKDSFFTPFLVDATWSKLREKVIWVKLCLLMYDSRLVYIRSSSVPLLCVRTAKQ